MDRFRSRALKLVVCAVLLAAPWSAWTQTAKPEALGFSAARLERVAELMQRNIDARNFAGAVTLVARDGTIGYLEAQGLMDIESGRRMREDAVFRIMSMTKPVVAVSLLILAEDGKLRITDPVSRFIPEFGELDLSLRELLTHTAGFMTTGGASGGYGIAVGPNETLADVVPRLAGVPLDFEPGTRWAYSGQFAFDVLARVVEVASGIPFDEFAASHVFGPLRMQDTFFYPAGGHTRIATLYQTVDGELIRQDEGAFMNGVYFSGGGGLFSTARDYFRFAQMLLDGGALDGERILSPRGVELMSSVFVPDTLPGRTPGEGFGLGVRVVTDPAARNTWLSRGSFGWSGAYNTHFFIDPEQGVIGIFMTQSAFYADRQQLRDDFETAVMQALAD